MSDHEQSESRAGRSREGLSPEELVEQRREIDAERVRRLDPANRPAMSEVDNSGVVMPTVAAWTALHAGEAPPTADPGATFRDNPPTDDERAAHAAERIRRLDPANRPPGCEVDNTGRTFRDGRFVD